ncbi:MAG: hypothetical protein K9M99_08730 [Candidatus Cloacimonetes bacterium]|nr:hypothetical protein [Candidatus Cloacimonadota bacterium]
MNKYIIIIAFIVVLFFCSCTSGKKSNESALQMEFTFDSTRVEAEYNIFETGYYFKPPAGMKYVNNQIKSLSGILQKLPFEIDSLFCNIFLNKENNSLLFLDIVKQNVNTRQEDIFKNTTMTLQSQTEFLKDDLLFHQLIFSDENNIILILLHQNQDHIIEFHFIIPLNIYNDYSRSIESAISTIEQKKEKIS